jgi:hypothetical protein
MATKTKKPRSGRRPRQPMLMEDLEPPRIKELDDAADDYHALKEQRMELTKQEAEAKQRVVELMKSNDLVKYTTASDLEVTREHETVDMVKVKRKKPPTAENGEAEDGE